MIYNISPDKKNYYRQNNNKLDPKITCKPTATVEALALAGWPIPHGEYAQAEDNLTELCRSKEAIAIMLDIDKNLKGTNPNEIWQVIAWAINQNWYPMDKPMIGPRWNWTLREALYGITRGIPFVASTNLTTAGHVVNIVGFITDQEDPIQNSLAIDFTKISCIIVDDPYGDRTAGKYDTKKSGWNNKYPLNDFMMFWKGVGVQIRPRK